MSADLLARKAGQGQYCTEDQHLCSYIPAVPWSIDAYYRIYYSRNEVKVMKVTVTQRAKPDFRVQEMFGKSKRYLYFSGHFSTISASGNVNMSPTLLGLSGNVTEPLVRKWE